MRIFFEITRCRRGGRVHTELISCACMRHRAINSRHRNGGKVCSKRRRITPINYEAARRETRDRKRERGHRKCKFRSRRSVVERNVVVVVLLLAIAAKEYAPRKLFRRVEEKFCYCKQSKTKRIRGFEVISRKECLRDFSY